MTYLLRRGRDVKRKNLTESTTQITVIQTFISTTFNIYLFIYLFYKYLSVDKEDIRFIVSRSRI